MVLLVILLNFQSSDPQFISTINPFGYALSVGDYGLTMGQMLSAPMILVGVFVIYSSFAFHVKIEEKTW